MPETARTFDPECRRCARLAAHLSEVRERHPDYYAKPVPAFGATGARLLVVGLAPGLHGANRTGRAFTGDASGVLLYRVLFETGFANRPIATAPGDGLVLRNCRITNAVKCLPPGNRPSVTEIANCGGYLRAELAAFWNTRMRAARVIVALGRIAHDAVTAQRGARPRPPFRHGVAHRLAPHLWLIASYHPSRQNVNTGRLTPAMLRAVFARARDLLDGPQTPA